MFVQSWRAAALAGGLMLAPIAAAAERPPAEVSIPGSQRIAFVSKVNGHAYAISVAVPLTPPPPKGYGVIYVLDGDGYFASVVEATRTNRNAPNVVVVGVGYPKEDPAFAPQALARHGPPQAMLRAMAPVDAAVLLERMYDMTLPASDAFLATQAVPGLMVPTQADAGGLDDFLKTMETEVKPRIAGLARIDPANQAIFGHSLGGLAVIHALFTQPQAYRSYIAASPSIWWADRAVLAGEPAFSARVASGAVAPRLLLTVGGDEEIPMRAYPGVSQARLDELTAAARMTGNARELTERLQGLKGAPGYRVEDMAVFANQGHGLSPWPSIGRAVAFAFPPFGQ